MSHVNEHYAPQEVIDYFARDPIINSELSEWLRFHDGVLVEGSSNGALVSDKAGRMFMVSATDPDYGAHLLSLIPADIPVVPVCQEALIAPAKERFGFDGQTPCYRLAYLKNEPIQYEKRLDIRPATMEQLDLIAANYHIGGKERVVRRIENGQLWCGWLGDEFVGFIGRHDRGTLGMLHVFDRYRRQGYAHELESFLINDMLAKGELPRGDVIVGNEESLKLQKKLGFEVADSLVYWLFHERD